VALTRDVGDLERQLRALRLIVETSLLLLWRHVSLSLATATALAGAQHGTATTQSNAELVRRDATLRRALLAALRVPHAEPRAPSFALIATLDGVGSSGGAAREAAPFAFAVARRLEQALLLD
jgi:hypothetical protein